MQLTFGLNPWALLLALLIAGGFTYWTYRETTPPITQTRRFLLIGLRFTALSIVLTLLFEPIFTQFESVEKKPTLAVLIDNSQSLDLQNGEEASTSLATAVEATLRSLPTDAIPGDTRFFSFDGNTRFVGNVVPSTLDSLAFNGDRTNIANALGYARDALSDANFQSVLLISDGQYNAGRNPLHVADRYPVPIYTVALGDTARQRDVQIRRITTNEIAYLETEQPVQVAIRSEGYANERVVVSLLLGGEVLGSETVVLPEGAAEIPVEVTYVPKAEGLQRLTVSVSRLDGELTYQNNTEAVTVRVLQSKKRVLLLSAPPNPDLASIRQALNRDSNLEVISFVQKEGGTFYEGSLPTTFNDFDAIILAGYPGQRTNATALQQVQDAATNGVPILFVLSRQTDLNVLRRNFADVLPAAPQAVRSSFAEAAFIPVSDAIQHPIFDFPDAANLNIRRLPPLLYNESRWRATPDARVLATLELRGIPFDDPLFVVRRRGASRTAAFLGTGLWRWQNVPEDLSDVASFWDAFFANTIQWLTTPEDNRPVRIAPIEDLFSGNDPVQFHGQVYDESLNPINNASVEVEVTASDGRQFPYSMEAVGNGRYTLAMGTLPEGTYSYTAHAQRDGIRLGEDQGSFSVGALTLEYKETRADAALMRQIAQRSGGHLLAAAELANLPNQLVESGTFQSIFSQEETESELWHLYPFLAIVIVLLTTEWFLRKRSGMV